MLKNPALRHLALHRQGLTSPPAFGHGASATHRAICHLGYVQIDTLSVVERAHHHVLWNRVPDYQPAHLNQLIGQRAIFEYWFHAAAYLPMRDYRYALPQMAAIRNGESRYFRNGDPRLMKEIVARITADGPMRMRHLDQGSKDKGSWWNQGPGRQAFETLFMQGELMVCERNGMEKCYDLTARCLPDGIDLRLPTSHEQATHLFETTLRAHGVFTRQQLLHLRSGKGLREAMREVVEARIATGQIAVLDTADGLTGYVDTALLDPAPRRAPAVKILSPFDNLVIHRERLSALFGFDYRIECYVPAAKRRYGYFCLPLLYGNRLVGRIDCKAHRSEGRLQVLSLHLDDARLERGPFLAALGRELQRFAAFNGCPTLDDAALRQTQGR